MGKSRGEGRGTTLSLTHNTTQELVYKTWLGCAPKDLVDSGGEPEAEGAVQERVVLLVVNLLQGEGGVSTRHHHQ